MNERLSFLGKLKNPKLLVILGLCGILLIFLSSLSWDKEPVPTVSQELFSTAEYKKELEQEITEIVEQITGDQNISVMVTLDSGIKYTYAEAQEGTTQTRSEADTESTSEEKKQSFITVKSSDGGEDALLIAELMPEIRGVAIVCNSGDREAIRQEIENTVTAALNITSKRVYIAGGSSYENQ